MLEVLTEHQGEGRVTTWRIDAKPGPTPADAWRIADVERLTVVNGLFRLALDKSIEYDVQDMVIRAPDLTLSISAGQAFVARTHDGPTAIVVTGHGRAHFAPAPASERGQLRIFSGSEILETDFDTLFIRLNPADLAAHLDEASLRPRAVDPSQLRRASQIFETYITKSFEIDLNDLSVARWSLVPSPDDFVAEIHTRRYGPLTYARATAEPEDISFFDRSRRHNISVYTSADTLAARGRFFSDDDRADYDVTRYDIEASFTPERLWIEGTAKLSLHTRANALSTLMVRLADPLTVRSITSPQYGRLLHLRIVGQNSLLIGLPGTIAGGTDLDLVVSYGGRLAPQTIDSETLTLQQSQGSQPPPQQETIVVPPEPQFMYSNRSFWYPQSPVAGYATATMRLTVPEGFDVVASGTRTRPVTVLPPQTGQRPAREFVFDAVEPARYLSCLVSRFQSGPPVRLALPTTRKTPLALDVTANARQFNRVRGFSEKTADILTFYASLLRDAPYDSFTVALTDADLPGGHSPAYFAMLNQPLPSSPFVWNSDPVSFQNFPSFFLAHEVAHQWWGQGVGWKNYHEQWLSEGFAQYFAALYAERERGPDTFATVLRQMGHWAIVMSPQGPVYLGYRLGHIKGESRVFRALVYNKGAMVLHMLRRFVGDEAFFAGLRDFYSTWRYKKAGTDDFRVAMEHASGRPLQRFFDRWIFDSAIPTVHFTSTTDATRQELHVTFAQQGEVFDIPVTVTVTYADGKSEDVVVAVTDQTTTQVIPLKGPVRSVDVNRDGAALAVITR
jgi:hypothetical protein